MTKENICNPFLSQEGFSALVIIKNGKIESMIKFPDDMDKGEWDIVSKAVDSKLRVEDEIIQYRQDRQIRIGLELMEKIKN